MLVLGIGTRVSAGGSASLALFLETTRSLTSSHSEAKEGDFSSLFFPMLQLERDSLRLPIVASSVGEQVRRSESDLDKLRLSLSSALGLLVGGARLLAPLGSPSSSAPPGRGKAVRIECSDLVGGLSEEELVRGATHQGGPTPKHPPPEAVGSGKATRPPGAWGRPHGA